MQDIFTKERQAWLTGARRSAPNDKARMQAKFDAARAAMGNKYCCHPSRRVQRLDAPWHFTIRSVDVDKLREAIETVRLFPRS